MTDPLRLLIVDDNPDDRALVLRELRREVTALEALEITAPEELEAALESGGFDLVITDYQLRWKTGLEVLAAAKGRWPDVPVVMFTDSGSEEIAVEAMKKGLDDYILKSPEHFIRLRAAVRSALEHVGKREAVLAAEARLRSLFDTVPVALFRVTPAGQILDANPAAVRMFGYRDRESLLRATTGELYVHPADHQRWQTMLDRGEPVREFEVEMRRPDGTTIWASLNFQAARESRIGAVRYDGAAEDITERKRALAELQRSEEQFRSLIENVSDVIAVLEPDGRLRYVSSAAQRVLGYGSAALVGRILFDFVPPEDVERLRTLFAVAVRELGQPTPFENRFRHRDGSWRILEGFARTVERGGGRIELIVNARDLTERRQAEEQIRLQREGLAQRDRIALLGYLLAGVAHELNNPLAVVMGRAALLRERIGSGEGAQDLQRVVEAADRCARIVKNFLDLARPRPSERQSVSLNQVARDAVELLAYGLRVDTIEVDLRLDPELPLLWADGPQLHQVVINLVSNAHQAMREHGQPRVLTLTTGMAADGRHAWIAVADTGPGMSPEVRERIFEPFFTTKSEGQGTGLGLSLCRGIVESHDGRIDVESEPSRGTTFTINLPVAPPIERTQAPGPPEPGDRVGPRHILVVDDEIDIATLLVEILSAEGHQVATAENGVVALTMLDKREYDLILCDLRMPMLDGPGLYRELRQRRPELVGRLVFITGDALSVSMTKFLMESGRPRLSKPFSVPEIREIVAQALRGGER
jgi:PAS domain S-box-containing protein